MVGSYRTVRAVFGALFVLGAVGALASSAGLDSGAAVGNGPSAALTIRAKGEVGDELMEIRVGDIVLATFMVDTEWGDYVVEAPAAALAPDVQVAFVNDRSRPRDRNLWVDSVSFGGKTYETESPTTYSTGVWARGGLCRPGHYRFEGLACNGYFGFGDLPGTESSEPAPIIPLADEPTDDEPTDDEPTEGDAGDVEIVAAGNVGSELIELRLAGELVAAFELGSSPNLGSDPAFQTFRYQHSTDVDSADVAVAFVNDRWQPGYDRNVRVSSIAVGDTTYDGLSLRMSLSPRADAERCRIRWDSSRILSCNGVVTMAPKQSEPGQGPVIDEQLEPTDPQVLPPTVEDEVAEDEVVEDEVVEDEVLEELFHPPVLIPEGTPVEGDVDPSPGRFYVVGDDIVDPNGDVFYPIGANVAIKFTPYGYVFEGSNGGIGEHVADAVAWNWNTVRATLVCDNTSGVPTFEELVDGIDPAIERLTKAGLVVILECHDLTGSDPTVGSADERRIRRFWDEMTARYHDNPYVWFNVFNEPFVSENTSDWAALHEFYVDRIRATGAENIMVADLPYWGQGIDLLGTDSFADELNDRCNTVFGWHAYGAIDQRQGSFDDHEQAIRAAKAKDMALIVGEVGVATPTNWGNAGPWHWNLTGFDSVAELGPRYGIGLLWWHATGDTAYHSLYALKNDRSGFWTAGNSGNLTPYGQRFWDISHQVNHDLGPFDGDLADSNCATALR